MGWGEGGGRFRREGTYVYLWLIMWLYVRSQHNTVIILQLKRIFFLSTGNILNMLAISHMVLTLLSINVLIWLLSISTGLPDSEASTDENIPAQNFADHIKLVTALSPYTCCSFAKLYPTLWPHGLQHARFSYPSLSFGVCSNSCPLSWWCHPTTSTPFSSAFNLFLHQGIFQHQLFESGGVLEHQLHHQSFQWIFRVDFL